MSQVKTYSLYELQGYTSVYGKTDFVAKDDYTALQQKLDALAAELSAIREQAEDVYSAGYRHGHLNTVDGIAYAPTVEDEFYHNALEVMAEIETPATDAYLNSVRADAVQALWDDSLKDVGHVLEEIRAYDDASEAAGIVHSEIKERVEEFAAQLRAGETK